MTWRTNSEPWLKRSSKMRSFKRRSIAYSMQAYLGRMKAVTLWLRPILTKISSMTLRRTTKALERMSTIHAESSHESTITLGQETHQMMRDKNNPVPFKTINSNERLTSKIPTAHSPITNCLLLWLNTSLNSITFLNPQLFLITFASFFKYYILWVVRTKKVLWWQLCGRTTSLC